MGAVQSNFELFRQAERAADNEEQCRICDKVLRRDPRYLPALELKAKAKWRSGKFVQALESISKAIAINPHEPGYLFLRADCLQHLARYGEAVREFEKCIDCKNAQLSSEAHVRIKALNELQEAIIAELMNSSPAFRAQYRTNPAETLQAHGFAFAENRPDETHLAKLAKPALWARPS